ncbi:TonB-dependent receptor family protein [Aquisalimonas asiatica]|uniref:Iron complex outermembrane recepter protein n=1 Tax=Aquisalimonas asiatica TaxID=406100 RepID=A0A1H8S542_9GAMM|nr:TonB-dependent receptor [Aquisalimonas asiatica]SEO74139.1 iron complex outermembrane recepter protein [Aquisalimonas asiatica]
MDHYRRGLPLLAFAVASAVLPLTARADQGARLEPVVVTSPRLERDLHDTPAAVGVVDVEEIQQGRQQLQLDESVNRVPGVFFQNRYNFAQNLRLSIRGFGARAPFGVRGIRILVDGIPETLPDGQSQVDAIDLQSAERVEVIRGPSSALYGNAAGGVVDIRTMDGPAEPYAELLGTMGSYGFQRYGVMGGGERGPWNAHISAWDMQYDGYREQSRTEKRLVNAKARYDFDADRSVTTVFTALDQPVGQDPAGLSRDAAREDPRQARDSARNLDAGQEVEQQRIGVIYRDGESMQGEWTARAFYTNRDFRQQLPTTFIPSLIAFDRDYYGAGADYTDRYTILGRPATYTAGTEIAHQRDDRQRDEVDQSGNPTNRTQDSIETATSAGVYGQTDIALPAGMDLTLGARYDRVRFRVRDRQEGGAASGTRNFDEFSAVAGLGYQLTADHRLYANVANSFETPTFTEFYDATSPEEGFDPGLDSQRATNVEIGLKGFLGARAQYDVAVFRVDTRDEIVVTGSEDNANEFGNAGRTRREGLEAAIEFFFTPHLSLSGAYTASRFRYRDFEDDGEQFDGNRLPGLPDHQLFGELAWRDPGGVYAIVDALIVDSVYADSGNQDRVSGYGVVNARVGTRQTTRTVELETFVGVNNLTNKDYFSNIRINDNGRNYFEPAPERNVFAGVRARF